MSEILLLDTDVLIDLLRSRSEAVGYLAGLSEPPFVSVVTVAELYAGVREGTERKFLDAIANKLKTIPVSQEIAIKGGLFRRKFFKSHGVGIIDAIIAATAEIENATVVTLNEKHFPMFSNVIVPYRKA